MNSKANNHTWRHLVSDVLKQILRDALAARGLVVEDIDHELITKTIAYLTPAQRFVIRLRFGLTGLPPMSLEAFCKMMGDTDHSSVQKINKDGMNSLTFKIYMAIKADEKPTSEPDPEDGQIRLNGNIATEEEVRSLNTPCGDSRLSKWNRQALAEEGILFIGDLIQRTKIQIRAIKKIGRKGLISVEVDLDWEGLSLDTRVTGWQRPTTSE